MNLPITDSLLLTIDTKSFFSVEPMFAILPSAVGAFLPSVEQTAPSEVKNTIALIRIEGAPVDRRDVVVTPQLVVRGTTVRRRDAR